MISDPAGLLEISAEDWSLVEFYRFGMRTADFVICRRCGVFIAAISDLEIAPYAVVNVNCLDDRASFTASATMHEFQTETLEARTSIPAVGAAVMAYAGTMHAGTSFIALLLWLHKRARCDAR
jgi:hypothetical protein